MKSESTSANPLAAMEARLADLQKLALSPEAAEIVEDLVHLAEETKQEKAAFVSTVAHELRIPMTSIMGYADLLKGGMMGELNESQLGFLVVIRENVGRMSKLITDLSDIYKIESGRLNLEAMAMPLSSAVNGGVDQTKDQIEARNQQVSVSLPEGLPMVFADPKRAAQMVNYLLENAVLYSPEGSPIEITAEVDGEFSPPAGKRSGHRRRRSRPAPGLHPVLPLRGRSSPRAQRLGTQSGGCARSGRTRRRRGGI